MRRSSSRKVNKQFTEVKEALNSMGWLTHLEPLLPFLDDTWQFRKRTDRLQFLFITESDLQWDIKRFDREPFGDFTNPYKPMGKGQGKDALLQKLLEVSV